MVFGDASGFEYRICNDRVIGDFGAVQIGVISAIRLLTILTDQDEYDIEDRPEDRRDYSKDGS